MDWKEISKERIQREVAGFFIIKPKNARPPIPLFCSCCANRMKNAQDAHCFRKWEACYDCTTEYAEPNREKWQKGWRPKLF
jgi:hypothetical protein